jgi:anion-transporting  ArsA/GET3 family ATPase
VSQVDAVVPSPATEWAAARLHVVTGKGGTGKTTVAAALAVALARGGRRVLLAEVEDRQGISQTLDVAPLAAVERRVLSTPGGGEVIGIAVDPKAALLEYLQIFYRLGRAGGALERIGAIDFATTIAPGVRDVLLVGKIYEANRRPADPDDKHRRGPKLYDAIVLDAPPTGRVAHFLSVNAEVAGLAKVGPIRSQADSITRLVTSSETVVHLVTLLEEMPVQETLDAIAELRKAGLRVGAIVVNQVRDQVLADDDVDDLLEDGVDLPALARALADVGIDAAVTAALVTEGIGHAERIGVEATQLALVEDTGRPIFQLPALSEGIDANAVAELATVLRDQGMVS